MADEIIPALPLPGYANTDFIFGQHHPYGSIHTFKQHFDEPVSTLGKLERNGKFASMRGKPALEGTLNSWAWAFLPNEFCYWMALDGSSHNIAQLPRSWVCFLFELIIMQ